MRDISIGDIEVVGEELADDRLERVYGGLDGDLNAPTINWNQGTYDAPGTSHLTKRDTAL